MKAEIGRSAKIENDQNENPTTFCNNSNCFLQHSVAASVSQAQVYIFEQNFQSRFCDVRWETQPQSLSLEEEQMTWWGPRGWGNFWGRGKLLMIPLFAFGWESAFGKKSSLWSRWKLIFIDASCHIGFTAPAALYHISFVCQQHIFAIKTPMEFIFKSMDSSLCWKNTAPCKLAAKLGWDLCVCAWQRQLGFYEGDHVSPPVLLWHSSIWEQSLFAKPHVCWLAMNTSARLAATDM